jgi:hypothetical protein
MWKAVNNTTSIPALEAFRRQYGTANTVYDRLAEARIEELKIAALPKLDAPESVNPFDGTWQMVRIGRNCRVDRYAAMIIIRDGATESAMGVGAAKGSVSPTGAFHLTHPASNGGTHSYSGTIRGESGSGTFRHSSRRCRGTFTLTRR